MMLYQVLRVIKDDQDGFMTNEQLAIIAGTDRLRQILVRCGNCRFLAAAQDTKHLIDIITRDDQDYVRDISLPSTDSVYAASTHAEAA